MWRREDFHLQKAPDREFQRIKVWQLWQPIRQSPEFCQQMLGGPGGVDQRYIH
jgi:hypothetical protein